jgi:hypothetical protein
MKEVGSHFLSHVLPESAPFVLNMYQKLNPGDVNPEFLERRNG